MTANEHRSDTASDEQADWSREPALSSELDAAFAEMVAATRSFQNALTAARPTVEIARCVTKQIDSAAIELFRHRVDESSQIAGRARTHPGRSQAMSPMITYELETADRVEARVEFGRFYLGGNGAVHGGAVPLVFDEMLGRLANLERPRSRTANLEVNYRAITPIEQELKLVGTVERVEGRKLFLTGTLMQGDRLLADATGLFVVLRPGQP